MTQNILANVLCALKKIRILLLLDRMVCKYQVKLVMKLPQSSISLLILCLIFKEFFKWETKSFYIYSHTYHFWCFLFPCGHPAFGLASFSFCLKALLSHFWKNWSAGDKVYPVAGVVGAQTLWPCWALGALLPASFLRPLNTPHLETPSLGGFLPCKDPGCPAQHSAEPGGGALADLWGCVYTGSSLASAPTSFDFLAPQMLNPVLSAQEAHWDLSGFLPAGLETQ